MINSGQQERRHILSHVVPTTMAKLLNNAIIVINLWWAQKSQFLTVGMGFATIFSFVLGYLLIMSLNLGLTYEISRKRKDHVLIGIFYQRALLVNFLFCAFLITPLLYVSGSFVTLFSAIVPEFGQARGEIAEYLYQLVPSIWAFAFYDTTQTFLQAQGRILAPLLIQLSGVIVHLCLISSLGPAWAKNFSDFFCSAAIYIYIIGWQQKLKSWTEWTIKCIKGWSKHMKFLEIVGLATYSNALFFFLFSLLGARLPRQQLVCHIYYINLYQLMYLGFMGIQEGSLSKLGYLIKGNQYESYRRIGFQSVRMTVGLGLMLILLMYIYEGEIHRFFMYVYDGDELETITGQSKTESPVFYSNFGLLALTLLVSSFFISVSSLLKALHKNHSILSTNVMSRTQPRILPRHLSRLLRTGLLAGTRIARIMAWLALGTSTQFSCIRLSTLRQGAKGLVNRDVNKGCLYIGIKLATMRNFVRY